LHGLFSGWASPTCLESLIRGAEAPDDAGDLVPPVLSYLRREKRAKASDTRETGPARGEAESPAAPASLNRPRSLRAGQGAPFSSGSTQVPSVASPCT